ncbi:MULTISPECIES: DMT family transporter [Acinetobacter]|uniref:DMT family transporter n=1 Tax=Acinetobacter TaxID=469 RepID=UPI000C5E81BF|nr:MULTISPECIES: DMT family transporter [Acinetobacter]MEC8567626.1 DMT family transporter [Pseudomonadota bacterium]MBC68988.1 EamA family transporter [Acinetobacter sp.]MBT50589.1 EamA family transporter [Acinetobacter sp.]HIQ35000.1 DMT family transporter [Acinetobacter venetianus]HJP47212.1 DMT family transporter [Acinetobacter venetianus]
MVQLSKYQKWAFVLPLIAVLIWSLNIAVTRYVADYISPVSISFYRWFVAFLILTPFMLPKVWKQRAVIGKDLGKLAVLSAFGMVLYQGLSYTAAHYTTATNMGIVNAFVPVFTIFISYLILKDVPNRFAMFGSLLSFAGLIYVMSQGHISSLFEQGGHWGDAVMVVAVGFYAFYGVFLKKWQLKLPLLTSLYVQIGFALLYHVPFLLWFGLDGINADNAASVLYAGVFPSLIAPLLWMVAVQAIGPNRTSIFMNLMPVFTAIIASLWLSEHWTIYHTIGGVMILVGIIMAQKKTIKVPSRLVETAS